MEIKPVVETLVKDTVAVAHFIGERAVGGAWAILANQLKGADHGHSQEKTL